MKNEVNRALVAKKKLTILFAALTLSAGMWAETINGVKYIDANGQEQTANNVTEITKSSATVTWNAGWYVVTGTDVQLSKGAVCNGAVHIILADGAKLTAKGDGNEAAIQVSGDGNSLTIYGQTAQSGQLIANGGPASAGIGGGQGGYGSNITINGGVVSATGGNGGAGIGGGLRGTGSNITINGGVVTANGGESAACIGGGFNGSGSNIKVATTLLVKADNSNPPTTMITNDGSDLANKLKGKRYVTIATDPLAELKAAAIEEIEFAIVGVTDTDILAIANKAKEDINAAATEEVVNSINAFALTKINALALIQTTRQGIQNTEINKMIDGAFNDILRGGPDAKPGIEEILEQIMTIINSVQIGKEEGQVEALGTMGTPCTGCTAVEVTDGTTTVTLYKPTNVGYIKK
ncbi:MAG: hypothetical protein MJZ75_05215 [Paludibacteraceae bacterium]|nr:hypothetical protein [Paludibacteraceae bacterium]